MALTPETRAVTFVVSDAVYGGLIERGRKTGYTPALYAKLLFEAAYAARCGKGESDALLQGCVEKSLARREPPRVAIPAPIATTPASAEVIAVPILVPVLLPFPVPIEGKASVAHDSVRVHVTGSQPISEEGAGHIATVIAAAIEKLDCLDREPRAEEITPDEPHPPRGWSASQWKRHIDPIPGIDYPEA